MTTVFAPFGNTEYFFKKGYNSSLEMPSYLAETDLNGYEYSLEEGIHISDDSCEILKNESKKHGISLSVYSGKFFNSLNDCVTVAEKIGADRVIVPLGNCAVTSRKEVYNNELSKMKNALLESDNVYICPELMGLIHDLGTFEELLNLSSEDERFIPAINFPNLFSRNIGKQIDCDAAIAMFKKVEKVLGRERANKIHIYLSDVEYTNQGYKKYKDFSNDDNRFDYKPILEAVKKMRLTPFIVCRSPYNCYNEAIMLKNYYINEI